MQKKYLDISSDNKEYLIADVILDILAKIFHVSTFNGLHDAIVTCFENFQLVPAFNDFFDPIKNKFKLTICNDFKLYDDISDYKECWTDGACLLVKPSIYIKYLKGMY